MNPYPSANVQTSSRSLLTIPEVARRLRVGRTTIYGLLQQRTPLVCVHIGRAARIEASSVDEFIEQLAHTETEAHQDGQVHR